MLILSHRGYWLTPQEKNTPRAFARSFHLGFGTELDLRDLAGRLVVSHDPPGANALPAEVLFGIHDGIDPQLPLALNIKADGVQQLLLPIVGDGTLRNVFLFDMSVPDAVQWLRTPLPVFTRHSDVERKPSFHDQAANINARRLENGSRLDDRAFAAIHQPPPGYWLSCDEQGQVKVTSRQLGSRLSTCGDPSDGTL